MGLLDKAKEIKEDEEAPVSEPEEEEVTKPKTKKKASSPAARKGKKKVSKPGLEKKSAGKKPVAKKKAPMKKKAKKPKKEKVVEEPAEPTIEGLPEDLEFAGVVSRVVGSVLDGFILGAIIIIISIASFLAVDEAGIAVFFIVWLVLPFMYFLMMEGKTGETFGKRTAHVKVISLDGRPLNPKKYMKSAFWKGILFPFLNIIDFIIGFVMHRETMQRFSQYNDDLIVIAVPKKKVKFGYADEYDEEEEIEGDEDSAGDEAGGEPSEEASGDEEIPTSE